MTSRSTSLSILAAIAGAAALYLGQEVFVPIALGLMMTALVRPAVQLLSRIHVPDAVGATLVTLSILGLLGAGGYFLAGPLKGWMRDAPQTLSAARGKIEKLRKPIKQVSQAVEKAKDEVTGGSDQGKPGQQKTQSAQAPPPAGGSMVSPIVGRVFATTACPPLNNRVTSRYRRTTDSASDTVSSGVPVFCGGISRAILRLSRSPVASTTNTITTVWSSVLRIPAVVANTRPTTGETIDPPAGGGAGDD